MKFSFFFFFFSTLGFAQFNYEIRNGILFSFRHKIIEEKLTSIEFLNPYVNYTVNGVNEGDMMDAIILVDNFYKKNVNSTYNGILHSKWYESYLNDIFHRTKLPIVKFYQNEMNQRSKGALIGKDLGACMKISLPIVNPTGNISLNFNYNFQEDLNENKNILIGLEYYVDDSKIYSDNLGYYSEWYDAYLHQFYNLETEGNINLNINIPMNVNKIGINIINYSSTNSSTIFIDDIVAIDDFGNNLINVGDSNFEFQYNSQNTYWEYYKEKNTSADQFLFYDREPLASVLNVLNSNDRGLDDMFKLVLMFPEINDEYYLEHQQEFEESVKAYIEEILKKYDSWKLNNDSNKINIYGIYVLQEKINNSSYPLYLILKNILSEYDLALVGSPYADINYTTQECVFKSSFSTNIIDLFDEVFQQPNAFYYDYERGYMDSNLLNHAYYFIRNNDMGINIETNFFEDILPEIRNEALESYGRINDYFSYGYKYGFVNRAHIYYDAAGIIYQNARSQNSAIREDYINLHKFIRNSKRGFIPNRTFENEIINTNTLTNWQGNYHLEKVVQSNQESRNLNFVLTENYTQKTSENIIVENSAEYIIQFYAKELNNDYSIESLLFGINFFNNNGAILQSNDINNSNLTFSEYTNSYYQYIDTSMDYNPYTIRFITPNNSKYIKIFFEKWRNANIAIKDLKIYKNSNPLVFREFYLNNNSSILRLDNFIKFGNTSLELDYLNFAYCDELISVTPNINYNLKISIREKLPLIDETKRDKAFIGLKLFDNNGAEIYSNINGFNRTNNTSTPMFYKYFENVTHFWQDQNINLTFPANTSFVRIYLYNWYYPNSIIIDNISIEATEINNVASSENLFINKMWSQDFPLNVSYYQPAIYRNLINVENIEYLNFSAKVRDTYSDDNRNILSLEFYDENNQLIVGDLDSIDISWSAYYKYYFPNSYINCNSYGCVNSPNFKWYNNQWKMISQNFSVPANAKYLKIQLNKLSNSSEKFLILNPVLTISEDNRNKKSNYSVNQKSTDLYEIKIYPNPTHNKIYIDSKIELNFLLFDHNGIELKRGLGKDIDLSKFKSGTYYLKLYLQDSIIQEKIIYKN